MLIPSQSNKRLLRYNQLETTGVAHSFCVPGQNGCSSHDRTIPYNPTAQPWVCCALLYFSNGLLDCDRINVIKSLEFQVSENIQKEKEF
jgi:hypothetical protein